MQKRGLHFYLTILQSVKNEEENKQIKPLLLPTQKKRERKEASPPAPLRRERGVICSLIILY